MALISLEDLGRLGMLADPLPHDLPPEAWSNARNMRFRDNHVRSMAGNAEVFPGSPIAPYWTLPVPLATGYFWIVAGSAKVYVTDGTAYTNITRQSAGVDVNYTMNPDILWNGGLLGGVPVINNGFDAPQFWNPQTAATKLQNLTAWPANTQARVMRPFKQFLFALNVTKAAVSYQHMVKWSHGADPGTVPISWDNANPALDAGEIELTDTAAGPIVDGLALRDSLVIYKEGSAYAAIYVGGQYVFRFYKLFDQLGAMDTDCVSLVGEGDQHIVMTGDDLVVHNGQAASSVLTKKMRRWLANALSSDHFRNSFLVRHVYRRESWFCFPAVGQTLANLALVYDWDQGTITVRDIVPNASYIASGRILTPDTNTWDSDSGIWDNDPEVWDTSAHPPYQFRLLQSSPDVTKLFFLETGTTWNGTAINGFLERTGLAIYGKDREGNWKADITRMKLVKGLRPKIEGGPIQAQLGVQQIIGGPITWAPLQTFSFDNYKLDFLLTGRLIAVRFQTYNNNAWAINAYDLDIEILGEF